MPFADITSARDAIYGFMIAGLAAQIPSWTPVVIFDDDQKTSPPEDQRPYMRAFLRHTDRNQRSIGGAGGRRFRAKFQMTCKVYTMIGSGLDSYSVDGVSYPGADQIAQALMNVFQGKTTGVDQAQFYHVRSQEYGEDEGRFRTNVLINGDYDTIPGIVISAPLNGGIMLALVKESTNYSANGNESFIEMNAASGPLTLTVLPSLVSARTPIRVRKTDTTGNAVSISDGTSIVFALESPANAVGDLGGWCDVSSDGTNLRVEGVP